MAKTIKVKVQEIKEPKSSKKPENKALHYSSEEEYAWEPAQVHRLHRGAITHDLNLDPWLDAVVEDLVNEQKKSEVVKETIEKPVVKAVFKEERVAVLNTASVKTNEEIVAIKTENRPAIDDFFKSLESLPLGSNTNHKLTSSAKPQSLPPKFTEEPEVVNPVSMIWYVLKDWLSDVFSPILINGWWVIVFWFLGEIFWLNQQKVWAWPDWVWIIITWAWPIVCWWFFGWWQSRLLSNSKVFLQALWPIAIFSGIILAVLESAWFSGVWVWLNIISLPLLLVCIVALTNWLLVKLGRLTHS